MKTVDFLDQIKKAYGLPTDYKLAQFMGWAPNRITNYRNRGTELDDAGCLEVAAKLHVDAGYVLASIAAARATSKPTRTAWLALAEVTKGKAAKMSAAATVALFVSAAALSGFPGEAHAASAGMDPSQFNGLYIMSYTNDMNPGK